MMVSFLSVDNVFKGKSYLIKGTCGVVLRMRTSRRP